ncbi:Trp operon repressor [Gilliamella sp. wkB292]|nr:trp operon repressor [Gilliamella sp. B3835]MCX8707958.1 trp operon repressor [Gilliamella sp. B3783]MCX8710205.1 trp operon repressor [Gilliamella sp. B3780]MCX8712423.1 trp operon repressor [Gilliamella sp. B3468]MCX8714938.1 trp operon repressor [Gilliamella sp. B3781]MCX8716941.1 trp operon repressor [Gilliamella sp. B3784]MCX8719369.1 trp operon repressor [Gilliamella sp. B3788]MCX8728087.1 trp operon repressor [Gilliamella sp. B2838]MCX8730642.1 trp operon repressor [Gilliamella sp
MTNKMKNKEWQQTVEILHQAFNDGYSLDILKLLLTADERDALITRVKIVHALLDGSINQRQLKEQLGIGIATVTRGSNSLKEASPEFKYWLEQNLLND